MIRLSGRFPGARHRSQQTQHRLLLFIRKLAELQNELSFNDRETCPVDLHQRRIGSPEVKWMAIQRDSYPLQPIYRQTATTLFQMLIC